VYIVAVVCYCLTFHHVVDIIVTTAAVVGLLLLVAVRAERHCSCRCYSLIFVASAFDVWLLLLLWLSCPCSAVSVEECNLNFVIHAVSLFL
jgi:hypothetical protein